MKDELDLLEKEMARLKELGQEPAYQVQAVKYKYLKPLVESLEAVSYTHLDVYKRQEWIRITAICTILC